MNRPLPARRSEPGPQLVVAYGSTPSPGGATTLKALQSVVAVELDRKHRLGHYAVMWKDGRVVQVPPEDLPSLR